MPFKMKSGRKVGEQNEQEASAWLKCPFATCQKINKTKKYKEGQRADPKRISQMLPIHYGNKNRERATEREDYGVHVRSVCTVGNENFSSQCHVMHGVLVCFSIRPIRSKFHVQKQLHFKERTNEQSKVIVVR